MIDLTGQAAIVTGAGAGIGRAVAMLLAQRGAQVLVNDSAPDGRAEALVRHINASGGSAVANKVAVGTHAAGREIAAHALDAFGRVDILINNAGIARPKPFGEADDFEIDQVLAVNLLGPFALMRAVWPAMRAQRYGRIVSMSSSAAFGSGISGPYSASKAGLIGLTKDAAIAGESLGIVVNAVMPSAYTALLDNHPDAAFRAWFKKHMPPESVAAAVLWLASPEMLLTGEIFAAGGGRVSRITFLESRGFHADAITAEDVLRRADVISDMSGGDVVSEQSDHQANTARVLPGYPL